MIGSHGRSVLMSASVDLIPDEAALASDIVQPL